MLNSKALKFLKQLIHQCNTDNIGEYTAQCAYYTILALIPFLILVVTLLQYTGISKETFIWIIQTIVPSFMHTSATSIVQEVYSKSIETISISAIFLLWSARKGFYALSKGLHNVYETKNNYVALQIKSILLTVLLIILIIMVLILSVFGNSITAILSEKFNIAEHIINIFQITRVSIYIFLFLAFLGIYVAMSERKLQIRKQVPGAVITTCGWYAISMFFSAFIDTFKGFSVIYGSLTRNCFGTNVGVLLYVYYFVWSRN